MGALSRIVLFALVALPVQAAPPPAVQPTGTLAGRVVAGHRPVAQARVRAVPAPTRYGAEKPPKAETRTDSEGAFQISGLRAGWTYSVIVDRGAFAPVRQLVEVPARLRIRVRPGAEASGRVLDAEGKPIEGALVRLFVPHSGAPEGWRDPEMFVPLQTLSGPDGRFLYPNLASGRYDLQVAREGLAPRLISGLEVKDRAHTFAMGDIRLEPGAVIEGLVTDEDGRRVAGARVGLSSTSDSRSTDRYVPVESGADGSFRLESLPPGERFDLWINAPGFVARKAPQVEAPTSYPVSISLQRDRSLVIRVVDPEKRPVPQAYVSRVKVTSTSQSVGTLGQTDDEGSFRLKGLEGEVVDVLIQAKGFRSIHVQRIPVPADPDAEPVEIGLDRGAVLEGQVLDDDGNPVAEASVRAHSNPSVPFVGLAPVITDREGRYRLTGLGEGLYDVMVESPGMAPRIRATVEIGSGGDHHLDLRFPAGSPVSGQVVDSQGLPVSEARLTLVPLDGEGNAARTVARVDGTFTFRAVPDGDFRLEAEASGFAPARVPGDVRISGQPVAGLILRLLDLELAETQP